MFLRCESGSNFCFHFSTHVQCRLCCILHNFHLLHSFTLHIPVGFVVNTGHEGKQTEFSMRFLRRCNKNFAAFVENEQSRETFHFRKLSQSANASWNIKETFFVVDRSPYRDCHLKNEANSAVLENSTSQKSKRTQFPLNSRRRFQNKPVSRCEMFYAHHYSVDTKTKDRVNTHRNRSL